MTDQTAITKTSYAGNYIYEKIGVATEELKFFNQPEGYVEPNGSNWEYVYQYKDHLGNIRLSYSDADENGSINASTEIVEENNYYPFGLKHKGYNSNVNGVDHKYGFGGKEEQDDNVGGNQLNWLDFGARNYDAALGRWFVLDAFAEKAPSLTPYRYAFNNPINIIDPDRNYEQDDFSGQDDYYSSVTIYGGKGGPITLCSSGSSGSSSKKKGDIHLAHYGDGSFDIISKSEYNDFIGDGVKSTKGESIVHSFLLNLLLSTAQEANNEIYNEYRLSSMIHFSANVKLNFNRANSIDLSDKGPIEFDQNYNLKKVTEGFGGEYAYVYITGNLIVGNSKFGSRKRSDISTFRNTGGDGTYNGYHKINFYGPNTKRHVIGQLLFQQEKSLINFLNHFENFKKQFKNIFLKYYNIK